AVLRHDLRDVVALSEVLAGVAHVVDRPELRPEAVGQDRVGILQPRSRQRVDVREREVVAEHVVAGGRVRDVNAVARVFGEPVVDHAVTGLRERAHVDDDVEDLLARIVVLGPDERIDVGQVRLRILLDQRSVAVARGVGGSADEREQRHQGHGGHAAGSVPHDRSSCSLSIAIGHVSFQGTNPPASAWTAIDTPSRVITAEDVSGSQRVTRGPRSSKRATRRRAYTMSMPLATSTSASPTRKATISSSPKPPRLSESALRRTTSAAGKGTIPPVMPRAQSWRSETLLASW